jgi:hypothetical protein
MRTVFTRVENAPNPQFWSLDTVNNEMLTDQEYASAIFVFWVRPSETWEITKSLESRKGLGPIFYSLVLTPSDLGICEYIGDISLRFRCQDELETTPTGQTIAIGAIEALSTP